MCRGEEQGGGGVLWMGFWASYEEVAEFSSLISENSRIEWVMYSHSSGDRVYLGKIML